MVFPKTWFGIVCFIALAYWNCLDRPPNSVMNLFSFFSKGFDMAIASLVVGLFFYWLVITMLYVVIYLSDAELLRKINHDNKP